ncbi:MAG: amidophosphoribosyltransferase [Lentisphaeria bacterium]
MNNFDTHHTSPASPREKCGLCGVSGGEEVLELTHLGLHALQHRGQEAAGIMMTFDDDCALHADKGLVDDVFSEMPSAWRTKNIERAIAHVRYSTAGVPGGKIAQPLMVDMAGEKVGIAHNGTICNARSLRKELQSEGAIFQTTGDTELILHLMAQSLIKRHQGSIWDALEEALQRIEGAYSLLLMTRDNMVAVRDPHGFRPLAIGDFCDGSYMVASETISLHVTGANYVREVEPGEMIIWNKNNGMESRRFAECTKRAHCIFEHVYFARPGSNVFGDSVRDVRKAMGRKLAEEAPVDADVIMPVPDSGMFAALGYSEASGLPFDMGFTRNHYVGRTFIDPGLASRRKMVSRKLQPIAEAVRGRRVCLIEDSIVRGSTSRARISTLREVGAKEIHMRISCPPHRYGCYFGIDFPEREKLIANKMDVQDLAASLRLDSLAYLSVDGMLDCVEAYRPEDYCCACFTGDYPVIPETHERL